MTMTNPTPKYCPVLDPASGSRMFYFDKSDSRVLFGDVRTESHVLCDGRTLNVTPDMQVDFTALPFDDCSFPVVIFDPPHLHKAGNKSWLAKKYGVLGIDWRQDIRDGFSECFRVLKPEGVLIFKWNETQIPVGEVLKLTPEKPVVGHRSGKTAKTHWVTFVKASTTDTVTIPAADYAALIATREAALALVSGANGKSYTTEFGECYVPQDADFERLETLVITPAAFGEKEKRDD